MGVQFCDIMKFKDVAPIEFSIIKVLRGNLILTAKITSIIHQTDQSTILIVKSVIINNNNKTFILYTLFVEMTGFIFRSRLSEDSPVSRNAVIRKKN